MRSLTLSDPFRLFDSFFSGEMPEVYRGELKPLANIAETDSAFILSFEMPGVDEQDIDVQIHDRQLTVNAETKDETHEEGKTWHRVERRYGKISRSVMLPASARSDGIEATYKQGILTVTVQKRPESKPTKIKLKG
jgi:HSP20 family protein